MIHYWEKSYLNFVVRSRMEQSCENILHQNNRNSTKKERQRLFSSSSLSAIRVVSSACLRLLLFLLAILFPDCASSSLAFHLMYSAYKLNKHGDNIQPWHTPFPIWKQSIVPCPVLTGASWPAYQFLRRQVRWSGIPLMKVLSF